MSIVTIHKAKTELSKLIARVEKGETVEIARGKNVVAMLVPKTGKKKNLGYGSFAHIAPIPNSVWFEPMSEDELAAWEGKYSFDP
jgi:antitoxin (DNA-binding transcriptional repressor) of toxin-antitoxin stability system